MRLNARPEASFRSAMSTIGEVRSTSDFTLSEAWTGYANYKQTTASKAGTWEMQVLRGETVLSSAKVTVE